jgi:cleavage stimulation factor subunit 3
MAELTPEMAFLQSMQNEQIDSNPVLAEADSESDASIHDDSSSASEDADAPEEEENEEEEEDEDYDPSALITPSTVQASEKPNGTAQAAPVSKPRAKGGFIVDDSDEEEGGVAASASVGTNGLSGGAGLTEAQRSLTGTPLNGVASNDVQISQSVDTPLQDNNPTLNAPISSVLGATSSTPTPSVPVTTNTSEQTRPRASALPKVRLPTDTVGILEDRIAEDERGDIDAWLELINEHRSKNRLDDARKIYERYFQVFPTAVSSS